jgi:hypothetical protein
LGGQGGIAILTFNATATQLLPSPQLKSLVASLSAVTIPQSINLAYSLTGSGGSTLISVNGTTIATATTGNTVTGVYYVQAGSTLAATVVGSAGFAYNAPYPYF